MATKPSVTETAPDASLEVCGDLAGMMDAYCTRLAWEQLQARAASVAALRTPEDVAGRQRYIRETITQAIGGFPKAKTPLNARITGTLERDGYRVEKLVYESQPRHYVTANVYVPAGPGPFPAVLGCMGHYEEGKAFEEAQRMYIGFAKRGFVVLTYDPPDEGERKGYLDRDTGEALIPTCPEAHTMAGLQCLLIGRNFAYYELWDGIRAVDYLAGRGDVDAKRIGVIGNSGGGTQCSYLAVVEPRLAAAAPCCYITSWEKLWVALGPQDAEQNLGAFLADGLDYPDYLIAFAPKPFRIISAIQDFFPIDGARATHAEARRIYAILGEEEKAGCFEYDDGHSWAKPKREATYAWMERWLQGRAESAPEAESSIETIEGLNCTATGQVLTSFDDGLTVQQLAAVAAEEMYPRRRAATPEGAALMPEMIARRLKMTAPRRVPKVEVKGVVQREGYRIEKVAIETEAGILVPTLVFVPEVSNLGCQPKSSRGHGLAARVTSADVTRASSPVSVEERSGLRLYCAPPDKLQRLPWAAVSDRKVDDASRLRIDEGRGVSPRLSCVIAVNEGGKTEGAAPGGEFERMALEGHIVVAPDLRGLGESRTRRPLVVYSDQYDPDMRALLVGKTMAGMQVFDLLNVFAYAASRPDVDDGRIRVAGKGTAGIVGLYAAALERRIERVMISEAISSYRDVMRAKIHRGIMDLVVPGVLYDFDIPDVVEYVGTFKVKVDKPIIF